MSLDRTGMELNVILAEIVVLVVMMIQGGFIHRPPNFSTKRENLQAATVAINPVTKKVFHMMSYSITKSVKRYLIYKHESAP